MPELLRENGVYSHLVSDHGHYWEDGGCTYHTRYSTWELARGHEGDPWKGVVADPEIPDSVGDRGGRMWRQDWINRGYMQSEEDQPQAKTFAKGLEFIHTNHAEDNWFLQIETFDPHEPFYTQEHYKALYPHHYAGPHFDWPPYSPVDETPEQVEHVRMEYAASLSMCDAWLGKVLDLMDEYELWDDTMLIVNTDHGFLLGEHDWWAKCVQPFYGEVAHSPLFIWDPRCGCANQRRSSLTQTIDLPATLLEYFGQPLPPDMQGRPLGATLAADTPVRQAALFGLHGGHVNVTDGRYVYMRAPATPDNQPLYNYTLMPTHMRARFSVDELQEIALADPFPFTKGCRTLRVPAQRWPGSHPYQTLLFDLEVDPKQEHPMDDPEIEQRMTELLVRLMVKNDAPAEQFERLGLPG
jgi:arylsulfatase A-like enzyme